MDMGVQTICIFLFIGRVRCYYFCPVVRIIWFDKYVTRQKSAVSTSH